MKIDIKNKRFIDYTEIKIGITKEEIGQLLEAGYLSSIEKNLCENIQINLIDKEAKNA